MQKIKKFSLAIACAFMFVCSVFIFTACGKKKDTAKLYVFSTLGGYVQVNNSDDYIRFGDEGSRVFTFKEDEQVTLKAVSEPGYEFVKWEYTDDLDDMYEDFSSQAEINLTMDEDEIVVRAVFVSNGELCTITYPTNIDGCSVVLENGYTTSVLKGDNFKFRVQLGEAYSNSNIVVKANGVVLNAVGGIYTISNIYENIDITIEDVVKNIYQATLPQSDTGYTIQPVVGYDPLAIEHGAEFKLNVTPADKYQVVVKKDGVELTGLNNVYTISSVTSNFVITVEATEVQAPVTEYNITWEVVGGQTDWLVIVPISGKTTVSQGCDYQFTITPKNSNVNITNMVVKYNNGVQDIQLSKQSGCYTIENVQSDIDVKITGVTYTQPNIPTPTTKYTISFPFDNTKYIIKDVNGVEITDDVSVNEGESFIFRIELQPGYKFGASFQVSASGHPLYVNSGVVTINAVNDNLEIEIEGVEAIQNYTISFGSYNNAAYELKDKNNDTITADIVVTENTPFVFTVVPKSGYQFGDDYEVRINGIAALGASDTITINSVNSDLNISITGIEPIKQPVVLRTITIPTGTGYTVTRSNGDAFINNSVMVEDGSSFSFKVNIAAGYQAGADFKVKAGIIPLTPTDGVYTIASVSSDTTITIEGVEIAPPAVVSYKISFPFDETKYGIKDENGNPITDDVIVTEKTYTFKIVLNAGYKFGDGFKVTADGSVLTNENGKFTISNISKDLEIAVEGIERIIIGFNVEFEKTVSDFIGDELEDIPAEITFAIQGNTTIDYTMGEFFIGLTNNDTTTTTMFDYISLINGKVSMYGYQGVKSFNIGTNEFITFDVDNDEMFVNWGLVDSAQPAYTITVVLQ